MTEIIERQADLIPELADRRDEFRAAKQRMALLVSGIDQDQFNRRPPDGGWSMAECVDHLVVTGEQMCPRLEEQIDKARTKGRWSNGPFDYGFMGDKFIRLIGDAELPPKKLRAPSVFKPRAGRRHDLEETVSRFQRLQDDFIRLVEKANGVDLKRTKVTSAVTRLIRLSLGQWFAGLAAHQRRHLWQAEQAKSRVLVAEMT